MALAGNQQKPKQTTTMGLKIKDAVTACTVLEELIKKDNADSYVFSGATRIKLALNLRKLTPVKDEFKKQNDDLVKQYGTQMKDAEGKDIVGNFQVLKTDTNYEKFNEDQKSLINADSDVTLSPLPAEAFVGQEGDKTSNQIPVELIALMMEVGLVADPEVKK